MFALVSAVICDRVDHISVTESADALGVEIDRSVEFARATEDMDFGFMAPPQGAGWPH